MAKTPPWFWASALRAVPSVCRLSRTFRISVSHAPGKVINGEKANFEPATPRTFVPRDLGGVKEHSIPNSNIPEFRKSFHQPTPDLILPHCPHASKLVAKVACLFSRLFGWLVGRGFRRTGVDSRQSTQGQPLIHQGQERNQARRD
jgi:hypothetical protein